MGRHRYDLRDAELNRRLDALRTDPNPADLEEELSLLRLFCEDAAREHNMPLVLSLTNMMARLSSVIETAKYRRGELLGKAALLRVARRMVDVLTATVANRFAGWEDALEQANQKMLTVISETSNAPDGADNATEAVIAEVIEPADSEDDADDQMEGGETCDDNMAALDENRKNFGESLEGNGGEIL